MATLDARYKEKWAEHMELLDQIMLDAYFYMDDPSLKHYGRSCKMSTLLPFLTPEERVKYAPRQDTVSELLVEDRKAVVARLALHLKAKLMDQMSDQDIERFVDEFAADIHTEAP